MAVRTKASEVAMLQLQVSNAATQADKEQYEAKLRLAQIELRLTKQRQVANAMESTAGRIGSASMGNAARAELEREAIMEMVNESTRALDELLEKGITTGQEYSQAVANMNMATQTLIQTSVNQMSATFDALAEDFRKLGPEGEAMAAMSEGIATMTTVFQDAFAVMGNDAASAGDKMMAVMGAVSGTIQAIGGMQKAAAEQKVKAIDQEIAAEKKRDGKSKESLAKIAALEKKKDAQKRKAFEADKKMKIAQTVMATATGAIEAYKSLAGIPFVGPALGAAAAAMVVAMGAKQLATIQSMTYNGGGGNLSGGQPSSVSMGNRKNSVDLAKSQSARGELAYFRGADGTGGPENFKGAFSGYKNRANGGNTAFMVGEQGPELFVPETPGTIVPNDDVAAGGPTNINFSISAVDAAGVEDLLIRQQGNIIGMIREAANSYGQDFVETVDTSVFNDTTRGVSRY